jgi:hypothetical protein
MDLVAITSLMAQEAENEEEECWLEEAAVWAICKGHSQRTLWHELKRKSEVILG